METQTEKQQQHSTGNHEPTETGYSGPAWQLTALKGCSYPLGDGTVHCVLYRVGYAQPYGRNNGAPASGAPSLYAIGMESDTERALYPLKRISGQAEQVFDCMVRNTVSPCTLSDILEDISVFHS